MIKLFLTSFVAFLATTSLQADSVDTKKHLNDLETFRMIKEEVIAQENISVLTKRDHKLYSRDQKLNAQISLASIRGVEVKSRNRQLQRRERLAKYINF